MVRRSDASTALGERRPALNSSRPALIAIAASIGLLASMHSTSNWNNGIGLSWILTPASAAYVVPATFSSRRTTSSRLSTPHRLPLPPSSKPRASLGGQVAGVAGAPGDPILQLPFGSHAVGVDAQPAAGLPARHHHRADVGTPQQLVGVLRRYPHQQSAMSARGDRHVAVDQERQATEHSLFLDAALGAEQLADAVGEILVVGHFSPARSGWSAGRPAAAAGQRRS